MQTMPAPINATPVAPDFWLLRDGLSGESLGAIERDDNGYHLTVSGEPRGDFGSLRAAIRQVGE